MRRFLIVFLSRMALRLRRGEPNLEGRPCIELKVSFVLSVLFQSFILSVQIPFVTNSRQL